MNELGREALVKAAMDGVPQAFGSYAFGKARCGLGVLGDAIGVTLMSPHVLRGFRRVLDAFDLQCRFVTCPECGERRPGEADLIAHLNDDHKFDFLAIANKVPATP